MTHFRFVTTMTSPDIRKFCRDTCIGLNQLPTGYNPNRDKKIPVMTEIGFCKLKSGLQHRLKVVATLFLLPFSLVSKILVVTGKTVSRQHISVSSFATELLML